MKKIKPQDIEAMAGSLLQQDIVNILPSIRNLKDAKGIVPTQLGTLWDLLSPTFREQLQNPTRYYNQDLIDCAAIIIDEAVDEIFMKVHRFAQTKSGDISPEQCFRLDELKNNLVMETIKQVSDNPSNADPICKGQIFQQLISLIKEQTLQNIPDHRIAKDSDKQGISFKKR